MKQRECVDAVFAVSLSTERASSTPLHSDPEKL